MPCELKTIDGKTTMGEVELRALPQQERVRSSLKWLGIYWGIAVVCILVPMLHFVLTPGFLIVGIVVAIRVFKIKERVCGGNMTCPACAKPVVFKDVAYRAEFKEICPSCARQLYVHLSRTP